MALIMRQVKYKETTRNTEGKSEWGGGRGETREPIPKSLKQRKKSFGEIYGGYAAVCYMPYVHT